MPWITNTELSQRITELERKLSKYEQSRMPVIWQYEWQLWYDSIKKDLKAWDWRNFVNISWAWLKIKTWFSSIPNWYTNYSITWVWFKPKAIKVVVYSWNKVAWWNADDVWWTIQQQCIYADSWNYSDQNGRLFRFDNINRWDLVSFDNNWFTVKSDLSATMVWTCFW